jgi:K+ transporter
LLTCVYIDGRFFIQQDGWAKTLRLAFQCVGVLYGDIGTSPLFVYSSTFRDGVGHSDDLLGALSLIIYSFVLFTVIKYVYIAPSVPTTTVTVSTTILSRSS